MIIETLLFSQYIHRNRCHHDNVRHRPVTYKDLVLMNSVERLVRRSMCEHLSLNRNLDEPNMISSRKVGLSWFEYLFMNIERGLVCTRIWSVVGPPTASTYRSDNSTIDTTLAEHGLMIDFSLFPALISLARYHWRYLFVLFYIRDFKELNKSRKSLCLISFYLCYM